MLKFLDLVLLPATLAAIIVYIATPKVIGFAWKIGIIDDPKKNKHPKVIHTYPIPRGGGLAIYAGVFISSLVFLPLDKHLLGILAGAFVLIILGLLDDKYNLHPIKRLAVQFLVAGIPIAAGIGIAYLTNPFNGTLDLSQPQISFKLFGDQKSIWVFSDLFALFWIVTLMNFINIGASGLDGQLTGTTIIAAAAIAILSLKFSADITQWPVIILAAITMGAYLGFLPWHIYPQKIMPGFGGSTLAGFLLGILAILSTTKVGTLMVVLAVPLIDTGFSIVRRVVSGHSPFWGDRGHLHHKLLDSGWSKRKVAFFYWGITAILGLIALNLNASYKLYTIIGVSVFVGGILLWLTYRAKSKQ
jgi:UDP-GlcNAc:undecaprenyl-phosphate/decaprenyl-phosphate GlcNAc-1-phosphate transferase